MWRDRIEERISELKHPAWGPEHCRRLYASERDIADGEALAADDDILFAIAWLHDVGTFEEFAGSGDTPSECAAVAASRLLPEAGFPAGKLDAVVRIIREHSFEGDTRENAEARILRDADMLEFLGAVGLMRLFCMVGLEERVPDPGAALSLAVDFAETLPDKLFYDTSRDVARRRITETAAFVEALSVEAMELEWV